MRSRSDLRLRALLLAATCVCAGVPLSPAGEPPPSRAGSDSGKAARQRILKERLLHHFTLGVDAPVEWIVETREKNGARWDFTAGYLSGSAGPGEAGDGQWFFKYGTVESTLRKAREAGIMVWWTYYVLAASHPALYKPGPAQATPVNARVPETMRSYFEIFKRVLLACAKYPDVPVVLHIEPDEWGHLLLSAGMDPEKVDVKVGSSGMPELRDLPDNLVGWAKAFRRLRDMYAPANVLLASNPSGWDWRGSMTPKKWAQYLAPCGALEWELAVFETGDRDKGMKGLLPPYGDKVDVTGSFENHISWIDGFHRATGLYVVVWQAAMGNTYFRTCNNTRLHYCDNLAQTLLEGYPENRTIERYVGAGCAGWVFLAGQWQDSTHAHDFAKDGVTNPEPIAGNLGHVSEYPDDDGGFLRIFAGRYYRRPFPILGKPPHEPEAAGRERERGPGPPPSRVAPPQPNAQAASAYDALLRARLAEELSAGRAPVFFLGSARAEVRVFALEGADILRVRDIRYGTEFGIAWSRLSAADLRGLALAALRKGVPRDHALVAFYALASGETAQAEEHLAAAGEFAGEVRAAFEPPTR